MRSITAYLGISAAVLFCSSLIVFSYLNSGFSPIDDYVSKLGAKGQPYALWWNLTGFLAVGVLLAAFGWNYGRIIHDRLTGVLLTAFGVGFGVTAVPVDLGDATLPMSKAHTVAICLALAAWLFGLARIGSLSLLGKKVTSIANITALFLVLSMIGYLAGLWSMPVTHRLVFAVVFGWVVLTSIRLLWNDSSRD